MSPPWDLIDDYLDGELSPADDSRLKVWLEADPEHLKLFVRAAHLHLALRTELRARAARVAPPAPIPKVLVMPVDSRAVPPKRWFAPLALAASLTLMLGGYWWLLGPVMGEPTVAVVQGAKVRIGHGTDFFPARDGTRLRPGDVLRVGPNGTAVLTFGPERTRFTLSAGSELKLTSLSSGKRFDLREGRLGADVARQRPFRPLVVTTPNAEARVIGTKFNLTAMTKLTRLEVEEGLVQLADSGQPGIAAVKVKAGHSAKVAPGTLLAALPKTGGITREWWNGVSWVSPSDSLDDPRFPGRPDGHRLAPTFEVEPMTTNRFGLRLRGYVNPPVTGEYEFWLAAMKSGQLSLSPSEEPSRKVRIATVGMKMQPREWDATRLPGDGATQRSGPISLEAGKRYYIEALVTVPEGEGHLSVAWKRPGAPRELLTGEYLSPARPEK